MFASEALLNILGKSENFRGEISYLNSSEINSVMDIAIYAYILVQKLYLYSLILFLRFAIAAI